MELAKGFDQRGVQPAAVAVLRLARADDGVEARVYRERVGCCALASLLADPQVGKVEDAALRVQLGQQNTLAAEHQLGHRHEAEVAQLGDEGR